MCPRQSLHAMEQRTLAPRRILTFVVLTAALTATGVAAGGFGAVDPTLPDEFHPAQPLPGDRAEYALSLVHANGAVSAKALPHLRVESGPGQWTWDSTGVPRLAAVTITQTAGVWSYDPQGTESVEYAWGERVSFARDAAGTIYYERSSDNSFEYPSGYQGLLDGTTNYTSLRNVRQYVASGEVVVDCLIRTLPSSFKIHASARFGPCDVVHAVFDPDQSLPSGREHHALGQQVVGSHVDIQLRAIGQASTDFGMALVLEPGESEGPRLRVWYVEDLPYPVQLFVPHGDGNGTLHRLVSFQRGQPTGEPNAPAPLEPVTWSPLQAWGPSDFGVELAFKPSTAWQLALDDPNGRLRAFLAAHPKAYTEFAEGGNDVRRQGDSWRFQLREGSARFAVEIVRGPPDIVAEVGLPLPIPGQVTIQEAPIEEVFSSQEAPTRIPDLQSAAIRFQKITGEAPNGFTYTWSAGCPTGRLSTCAGPVAVAWREVTSSSAVPQLAGATLESNRTWSRIDLKTWGDGRLASLWTSSSSFLHRDALLPFVASSAAPGPAPPPPWAVPSRETVIGIGAVAGMLGLAYLFWPTIKGFAASLFSRTTDEEVLGQPGRRQIYEAIVAEPGIHLQALVRTTGQGKGTIDHHLRKLLAANRVVVAPGAGYTCYFPAGTDRRIVEAGPVLRAGSAKAILQAIAARPGANGSQIAAQVGLNRGTVLHHLKRLQAAGLVTVQTEAGVSRVFPTKAASLSLASF